jgi:hypothetical protein
VILSCTALETCNTMYANTMHSLNWLSFYLLPQLLTHVTVFKVFRTKNAPQTSHVRNLGLQATDFQFSSTLPFLVLSFFPALLPLSLSLCFYYSSIKFSVISVRIQSFFFHLPFLLPILFLTSFCFSPSFIVPFFLCIQFFSYYV